MFENYIAIVDLGTGNILSIKNALEKYNQKVIVTNNKGDLHKANKIVLPGVGAFKKAMNTLHKLNLVKTLTKIHKENKPILGICLGMQLLFQESNEFGCYKGLGFLNGKVVLLSNTSKNGLALKVPHIGWNKIELPNNKKKVFWNKTILKHIKPDSYLYYVHSYHAVQYKEENILALSFYGDNSIAAVVREGNTIGCQFHPEKSGKIGLNILKAFSSL